MIVTVLAAALAFGLPPPVSKAPKANPVSRAASPATKPPAADPEVQPAPQVPEPSSAAEVAFVAHRDFHAGASLGPAFMVASYPAALTGSQPIFRLGIDLEFSFRTRERFSFGFALPLSLGITQVSFAGMSFGTVDILEVPLSVRLATHFGPRLRARFDVGLGFVSYTHRYTQAFVGPQAVGSGGIVARTAAGLEWAPSERIWVFVEPFSMSAHLVTRTTGSSTASSLSLLYSVMAGALYRF